MLKPGMRGGHRDRELQTAVQTARLLCHRCPTEHRRLAKQSAPSFLADFRLILLTETRALKPISTPENRNLSLFTLKTKVS